MAVSASCGTHRRVICGDAELAKLLIQRWVNCPADTSRDAGLAILVTMGAPSRQAYVEELAAQTDTGGVFVVLQLGSMLAGEGLNLDLALQPCLDLAVKHAHRRPWLDHEVTSFAINLACEILAPGDQRVALRDLKRKLTHPNDPMANRVCDEVVLGVKRLRGRRKWLEKRRL